jgi:hypothetical protein
MKVNGFSGMVSIVIVALLLYMAYNYGKNGKFFGK